MHTTRCRPRWPCYSEGALALPCHAMHLPSAQHGSSCCTLVLSCAHTHANPTQNHHRVGAWAKPRVTPRVTPRCCATQSGTCQHCDTVAPQHRSLPHSTAAAQTPSPKRQVPHAPWRVRPSLGPPAILPCSPAHRSLQHQLSTAPALSHTTPLRTTSCGPSNRCCQRLAVSKPLEQPRAPHQRSMQGRVSQSRLPLSHAITQARSGCWQQHGRWAAASPAGAFCCQQHISTKLQRCLPGQGRSWGPCLVCPSSATSRSEAAYRYY